MSSMTEDCETGIYGAKPWTNQGVAPKPHNEKTPNQDNQKQKLEHTHTKMTRIGITKGSERKIIKIKTNQNGTKICSKDTLSLSQVCALIVLSCATQLSRTRTGVPRLCFVLISSVVLTWLNSCRLMSHSSVNYSTSLVN